MSSLIGTSADWYLMRASGFVALVLLTITVALGVANVTRAALRPGSRAVAALVHRNAALLAVVFIVVHVLTAISDPYVKIPLLATAIPGLSGYDPFWVGLGALSFDLIAAVVITSLLRARLGDRSWRLVHWLTYLSWPIALTHAIGSGSGRGVDTGRSWSTAGYVVLALAFASAGAYRLWRRQHPLSVDRLNLRTHPRYPAVRPPAATWGPPAQPTASSRRQP